MMAMWCILSNTAAVLLSLLQIPLVQQLLHQVQPGGEDLQHLLGGVLHAGLVHLVGEVGLPPGDADYLGGMVGWRLPWSLPVPPRVTPW